MRVRHRKSMLRYVRFVICHIFMLAFAVAVDTSQMNNQYSAIMHKRE